MGLVALRHVGSSQTRARTRVPCIGRRILNHCATREAPVSFFLNINECECKRKCKMSINRKRKRKWVSVGLRLDHYTCSCFSLPGQSRGRWGCFRMGRTAETHYKTSTGRDLAVGLGAFCLLVSWAFPILPAPPSCG